MSSAPWLLGIAKVTATRRIQPKITETTTEVHIPIAAIREALLVSSAVCADASNPVIVYCASSMPSPSTSRNVELDTGRSAPEARVVDGLREHVRERLVPVGDDDQDRDDDDDTDHVPPGGDHVQARTSAGCSEDVERRGAQEENAYRM